MHADGRHWVDSRRTFVFLVYDMAGPAGCGCLWKAKAASCGCGGDIYNIIYSCNSRDIGNKRRGYSVQVM